MIKRWRNFSEIEEVARRLRIRLGIDELLTPDLMSVVERLPEVYPGFQLLAVPDHELPDCEGKADCHLVRIVVRQSVRDGCASGDSRARMTLAHELGHIALGHSGTRYRKSGLVRQNFTSRDRNREESEAKQFAAVFLAPTYLARECQSADEISEQFGISGEAADIRFGQLAELIKQGSPSQRWKSVPNTLQGCDRDGDDDRPKRLPASVVDFLTEARRRGHPVTGLDGLDD